MIQVLFYNKFESILRDCVMITSGSEGEIDISFYKLYKCFLKAATSFILFFNIPKSSV